LEQAVDQGGRGRQSAPPAAGGSATAAGGGAPGPASDPLRRLRHWPSFALVGALRLFGLLPFRLLWALGMGLGSLGYFVVPGRRRVALTNLAICFPALPPSARRRLARRHFGLLGVAAVTQGLVWGCSRRRLARIVTFRFGEGVEDLVRQGANLILLAPHFLGLELGGAAYTALIRPGMYMYQKVRDPVVDRQMRRGRSRFGALAIERRDDLRPMVRGLRRGAPLYYLPDQDPGRRGVFVPFCGIPAATVATLGRLARLGGALVIPTCARYLPWGRGLELLLDPPLSPFPSGDPQADAALMNAVIEARMRTMPEQYFWVHRRFQTRPPGEPPIYRVRRR